MRAFAFQEEEKKLVSCEKRKGGMRAGKKGIYGKELNGKGEGTPGGLLDGKKVLYPFSEKKRSVKKRKRI